MKTKLLSIGLVIVTLISSASCLVGFNTSKGYNDEIENLQTIKEELESNYTELETNINSIDFEKLDDVPQLEAMESILQKIDENNKTIAAYPRTGVKSIDSTYDAAIECNNQIIEVVSDMIDYINLFKNLYHALAFIEDNNSQNVNDEDFEATLEKQYDAFENMITQLKSLDCPSALRSRLDLFIKKLEYYQVVIIQLYLGYSNEDCLRLQNGYYLIERIDKEYQNALDDFTEAIDIAFANTSTQSEEVDVLKEEVISNIDTLIKFMEGK